MLSTTKVCTLQNHDIIKKQNKSLSVTLVSYTAYFFDQGINIAIRQRALALQDLAVNIQMLVTVVNDSKHNFQWQLKQVNDKSMVVSVTVSSWSMCKHWGTPQAFFCCAKDTKYTEHPLPKAHNPEGSGTPLLCSSLLIPLSVHHEP